MWNNSYYIGICNGLANGFVGINVSIYKNKSRDVIISVPAFLFYFSSSVASTVNIPIALNAASAVAIVGLPSASSGQRMHAKSA